MLKKLRNSFLIIGFCAILLFPSIGGLFVKPDVSVENRNLTPFPEWSEVKALNAYEDYFVDRIAFRSQMVEISSFIDYFLFQQSMVPNVVIGKNGQLFYNEKNELIDTNEYLLGKSKVPEDWLDSIVDVQNEIQKAMDERGIYYMVVIAPTKQAVYPEDLPEYYQNAGGHDTVKNQIVDRLREETNVNILDLTDALIDEKKLHPVYLQTDSHWNYYGSFRGYEEITRCLQEVFPELPMLSRDMFTYSEEVEYNQNLATMLSLGNILGDNNAVRFHPEVPMSDVVIDSPRSYPDPNYASQPFYMIATERVDAPELPKAMMYRDSFAGLDGWTIGNLNRYLATNFSQFVSYTQYQIDFNYIDTENPDIVIYQVYEDNIMRLGVNCLYPTEVSADKPLYRFNTPLNGAYYVDNLSE